MLCIVIKGPSFCEAAEQVFRSRSKAGILEFRVDLFDFDNIEDLMKQTSLPVILTLRPARHGGGYQGPEKERLSLIKKLSLLNPAYIDVEHDVEEVPEGVRIIRSYHNFQKTPQTLPLDLKGDVVKIAPTAHSTPDALRVLAAARSRADVIGLCMGERGSFARVLSPLANNLWTYACLDETLPAAPGQITADELLETYNFASLSSEAEIYGLIGNPVSESPGHRLHNRLLRESGLNAVYVKMVVEPHELPEFIALAKQLNFRGLSVTMPLKEAVIPCLDEICPEAKRIGAVNTLVFDEGRVKGFNTDSLGALNAIENKTSVSGKKMLIIGAGGAAAAVAFEAKKRGADVFIYNRTFEKGRKLADRLGCHPVSDIHGGFDIYANCTPADEPIDTNCISSSALVMNINHRKTKFLLDSRERGCSIIEGSQMFALQAEEQFRIWHCLKHECQV
jgi:3-dehydroquinate dehydratase / shikimate dehydrogenase